RVLFRSWGQCPVHRGGLVLLHPADLRQRQLQAFVEAGQVVFEAQGVILDTVHEDDSDSGKGIVIKLADGAAGHLLPGESLLFQWATFVVQNSGKTVHGGLLRRGDQTRKSADRIGFLVSSSGAAGNAGKRGRRVTRRSEFQPSVSCGGCSARLSVPLRKPAADHS